MRKMMFVSWHSFCPSVCCVVAFVLASATALTQVPGSDTVPKLPTDPMALMLLAAKSNGLAGPDMQPWHLKATYKLLDGTHKIIEEGTYEESWASPSKYKSTITGGAFTQSTYGTDHGTMQAGKGYAPLVLESNMRLQIVSPLPSEQAIQLGTFELQHREINGAKLTCLNLMSRSLDPGQD